jgi:hypothetical protein
MISARLLRETSDSTNKHTSKTEPSKCQPTKPGKAWDTVDLLGEMSLSVTFSEAFFCEIIPSFAKTVGGVEDMRRLKRLEELFQQDLHIHEMVIATRRLGGYIDGATLERDFAGVEW